MSRRCLNPYRNKKPDSLDGIGRCPKRIRTRAPFQLPGGSGVSTRTLSASNSHDATSRLETRRPSRLWLSLRQAAGIGVTSTSLAPLRARRNSGVIEFGARHAHLRFRSRSERLSPRRIIEASRARPRECCRSKCAEPSSPACAVIACAQGTKRSGFETQKKTAKKSRVLNESKRSPVMRQGIRATKSVPAVRLRLS